jgi:hypothetical protein
MNDQALESTIAIIDNLSIAALQDRYRLNSRQSVYNRLKALTIKPANGRITADDLDRMDALDQALSTGLGLKEAIAILEGTGQIQSSTEQDGQLDPMQFLSSSGQLQSSIGLIEAIALRLIDRLQPADPLSAQQILERACLHGWHLDAKQLAPLLSRQRLRRRDYYLHGFRCRWTGLEWAIEKPSAAAPK